MTDQGWGFKPLSQLRLPGVLQRIAAVFDRASVESQPRSVVLEAERPTIRTGTRAMKSGVRRWARRYAEEVGLKRGFVT